MTLAFQHVYVMFMRRINKIFGRFLCFEIGDVTIINNWGSSCYSNNRLITHTPDFRFELYIKLIFLNWIQRQHLENTWKVVSIFLNCLFIQLKRKLFLLEIMLFLIIPLWNPIMCMFPLKQMLTHANIFSHIVTF